MRFFWHLLLHLYEYLANNETRFSNFLGMFEAKTREYFHGVCDNFLVPATEVPEMEMAEF